jgi:DNA-binding MarR family transcriptional regulator
MSPERSTSKAAVAGEAWGAVLDLVMGQRDRFFEILREFGLTPGDLRALTVLEPDAPRPMRSLAQAWQCDASNVTWMVDRLEDRGLVERRAVPADRRIKAIALTPLGVTTKARVFRRLRQPPAELLLLDRAALERLREALALLPPALRGPASPHGVVHAAPPTPRGTPPPPPTGAGRAGHMRVQ